MVRVEIQRIEPPGDVTDAMHRQMKAERDRRALVTEAEGAKRAAILRAEGVKESQVLEAEGQAEAIRRVADAERYQKRPWPKVRAGPSSGCSRPSTPATRPPT